MANSVTDNVCVTEDSKYYPRVLFYGSLHTEQGNRNESNLQLIKLLTREVLDRNGSILTREGLDKKKVKDALPIDNLVLSAAQEWCREKEMAMQDRVLSICLPERIDKQTHCKINREMIKLAGEGKIKLYSALLQKSDLVIFAGGREGVARLGLLLILGNIKRPILPLLTTGGAAAQMVPEVIEELSLSDDEALVLQSFSPNPTSLMARRLLDMGLSQKVTEHKSKILLNTSNLGDDIDLEKIGIGKLFLMLNVPQLWKLGVSLLALISLVAAGVYNLGAGNLSLQEKPNKQIQSTQKTRD